MGPINPTSSRIFAVGLKYDYISNKKNPITVTMVIGFIYIRLVYHVF